MCKERPERIIGNLTSYDPRGLVPFLCRLGKLICMHGVLAWNILYSLGCVSLVKRRHVHASMTQRATVTGAADSSTCTLCQAGAYSSVSGWHRSSATCPWPKAVRVDLTRAGGTSSSVCTLCLTGSYSSLSGMLVECRRLRQCVGGLVTRRLCGLSFGLCHLDLA